MKRAWTPTIAGLLMLPFALILPGLVSGKDGAKPTRGTLDTASIEHGIGKAGEAKGDVYKISLPRTDLQVTVDTIHIKPGFALGSWIAFKPAAHGAIAHGDLVLAEQEVPLVVQGLEANGIRITALHNHLIGESPRVMFLHFWGEGDAADLAQHLRDALSKTKTPMTDAKKPETEAAGFDAEQIQSVLGHKGTVKQGVLQVSVPRSEVIKQSGVELPPSMGT